MEKKSFFVVIVEKIGAGMFSRNIKLIEKKQEKKINKM